MSPKRLEKREQAAQGAPPGPGDMPGEGRRRSGQRPVYVGPTGTQLVVPRRQGSGRG